MARKDVSMEASASIIQSLVTKARECGVPDKVIHSLATPQGEELLDKIVEVLVASVGFFRKTEILTIEMIPALPHPTLALLQAKFSWIRSIEHDNSPTESVALSLGTVLQSDEGFIGRFAYEQRIVSLPTLGYKQAVWLVNCQDEFPWFMALPGHIHIDFPGLIVVDKGGLRFVPNLRKVGVRWFLRWRWIDYGFCSGVRVAVDGR